MGAAAAAARQFALDAQMRREQAELLGVVESLASDGTGLADDPGIATDIAASTDSNAPGVEIAPPEPEGAADTIEYMEPDTGVGSDLESIREELKRRQEN